MSVIVPLCPDHGHGAMDHLVLGAFCSMTDWIYTLMVHTSKLGTASLNLNFMDAKTEESDGERSTKDIQFQLSAASQGQQNLTQTHQG